MHSMMNGDKLANQASIDEHKDEPKFAPVNYFVLDQSNDSYILGRIVQAPTMSSLPDILGYQQQALMSSANTDSAFKLSSSSSAIIEQSLAFRQEQQLELTGSSLPSSSMMSPSTIYSDLNLNDELSSYGPRSTQNESTNLIDLNDNDVIGSVGMLETIIKIYQIKFVLSRKHFYGSYLL